MMNQCTLCKMRRSKKSRMLTIAPIPGDADPEFAMSSSGCERYSRLKGVHFVTFK